MSAPPSPRGEKPSRPASSPESPAPPAELRCARAGSRTSPAAEDCPAAGERFGGDTGPLGAAAMLPSLQDSLDGEEKELESSEEGGGAEERRPEPPPSSHYCLYSYRGSRCRARPPRGPAPAPPRTRARRPGRSLASVPSPRAEGSALRALLAPRRPCGPRSGTPVPAAATPALPPAGPCPVLAPSRRRGLCLARCPACMSSHVSFHPRPSCRYRPAVFHPRPPPPPRYPPSGRLSWAPVAL